MAVWIKTEYGLATPYRKPSVCSFPNEEEANNFIKVCTKYGIDITNCDIIPTHQAENELGLGIVDCGD